MTGTEGAVPDETAQQTVSPWRAAAPDIVIAAIAVIAAAGAGYAMAGATGATVVVAVAAVLALGTVRAMVPAADPPAGDDYLPSSAKAMPFTGYWRKRRGLADGISSMSAFDAGLRVTLQDLLAARLAERHGISLRSDPGAARRLLCRDRADQSLWFWVDPERPATQGGDQTGIPARTLARLIDRLERL